MQRPDDFPQSVGIVGAGIMGTGIAQVAAFGGCQTILFDARAEVAKGAKQKVWERSARRVASGKIGTTDAEDALRRIEVADDLSELSTCDVVIEAIIEDLDAKRDLFGKLERIVNADAILASNTSSIPICAIGAGLARPARLAGMHFFNPVPAMKLVEVIPGTETAQSVVTNLVALARRMGRTPVVVKDVPGFLVNFGGRAFTTEALAILQEGVATPTEIDAVMRDCWGFLIGPFQLLDLTGMDVNFPVTRFVHESYFGDPRFKSIPLHRQMFESGYLGRKTGRGFYDYGPEAQAPWQSAQSTGRPANAVALSETDKQLAAVLTAAGARVVGHDDGEMPIVGAPYGEDCAAHCARTSVDYRRFVGVDLTGNIERRITLMTSPGAKQSVYQSVVDLFAAKRSVTLIGDSPGFIAQRIVAMIANLGCEMAQMGIAPPDEIDKAMRLALNYPCGPFEFADRLSPAITYSILSELQRLTGDDRYRPSSWLRRRASLGLSLRTQ